MLREANAKGEKTTRRRIITTQNEHISHPPNTCSFLRARLTDRLSHKRLDLAPRHTDHINLFIVNALTHIFIATPGPTCSSPLFARSDKVMHGDTSGSEQAVHLLFSSRIAQRRVEKPANVVVVDIKQPDPNVDGDPRPGRRRFFVRRRGDAAHSHVHARVLVSEGALQVSGTVQQPS